MNDKKLIEGVRKHQCLYDYYHPRYTDIFYKRKLWKKISEEVSQPEWRCIERWYGIRNYFIKLIDKKKMGVGSTRKYKHEDRLKFLRPFIPVIKENAKTTTDATIAVEESTQTDEVESVVAPPKSQIAAPRMSPTRLPTSTSQKKIADKVNQQNIDGFLKGLAPILKGFSPYYQHVAKGRLFTVVHELEAQQLRDEKVMSSSPVASVSPKIKPIFTIED